MRPPAETESLGMFHYGLTGGIGTGKSTVGRMFAEHGVAVVDADRLARELLSDGAELTSRVVELFPGCARDRRSISRQKLAELVFFDLQARRKLEDLMHPAIWEAYLASLRQYDAAGFQLAILEAAVLLESRTAFPLCGLIVVTAPEEIRMQRLEQRDDLDPLQRQARMSAQMPDYQKILFADYLIENHASLKSTRLQVEMVLKKLQQETGETNG